ncbi:hypothetical protein C8R45DRAFT_1069630 [Mycena sanguinolenta]|nr:hypothetical protein C8R45DRAFT_1069630 [Mycena sanguinolenta]
MGKKVICTCPKCIEHWVTVDGQQIPGARITQQLRQVHELRTAANGSPEYAKPHKSKVRPIGVEEPFDEEDIKAKSSGSPGIVINDLLIVQLCAALIVWQNLKASISDETGNTILNTALELLQVALATQGIKVQLPKLRILKDLRTIYRNYTQEPEILLLHSILIAGNYATKMHSKGFKEILHQLQGRTLANTTLREGI